MNHCVRFLFRGELIMKNIKANAVNDEIQAGDLVVATPDDPHSGMIGRVLCINPVGSEAHRLETSNTTADVHVCFTEFGYSKKRVKEIEAVFSALYGEKKKIIDCLFDDVIMAPCSLIRITGIDKNKLDNLLDSELNAVSFCYTVLSNRAYAVTSPLEIPGRDKASREMSGFKVSRRINGYSLEIELTRQELSDAFKYQ
jgi:hypothetical protein